MNRAGKFTYDDIDDVTIELSEDRIKRGTDYSLTFKYNVLRIMCAEVSKDSIEAAFAKRNIEITQIFTY